MNNHDIELLSAYLDGELKKSELAKLEARLETDPELASVLKDIRAARTLLRKLPMRKAPRNFTLTRKMVGQNPPLPRAYPFFRLATTLAAFLLFFTVGLNFVGSQVNSNTAIYGFGMGGGGGGDAESFAADSAVAEEPAMAAPAPEEPAAPAEEPSVAMEPAPTEMPPSDDAVRVMETPTEKTVESESGIAQEDQPDASNDMFSTSEVQEQEPSPWISSAWQIGLAVVALGGALLMGLMKLLSAQRWK